MDMFMMLCGTPMLAMALIGVPIFILFNLDKVYERIKEWLEH